MTRDLSLAVAFALASVTACGSSSGSSADGAGTSDGARHDGGAGSDAGSGSANPAARTVIVIPLENKSDAQIYGDTTDAPYINGLFATAARATDLQDELPTLNSEPHYVWMEAGTNVFSDHTFAVDDDPSATNSTASTAHLSTQLDAAGLTWTAYQEGITDGTCPIASSGEYAVKHSPFVFFQDVSGSPPSMANARCATHYKALPDLAADLAAGTLPNYAFITPNLCHEMHGDFLCPSGFSTPKNIAAGDAWLASNLPPLIEYTHTHDAVIFLVWDEGDSSNKVPFLALGDHVVPGPNGATYNHGSLLKTEEELFGLTVLPAAASTTDFGAMFEPGYLIP